MSEAEAAVPSGTAKESMSMTAYAQLGRAVQHDKWLLAAFYINEEGKVTLEETTFDFPNGDHAIVLDLLTKALQRKLQSSPQPPLPMANHLVAGNGDNAYVGD